MMMSKLTLKRKVKFKDAYDIMKFGVESGNWKNSFATYYKIPSPTKDGMIYERVFYEQVAKIKLPWVSVKYMKTDNKKKYTTDDHAYKPQFGAKFLMDNPYIWIDNFDNFLWWGEFFSSVIPVTKKQNDELSKQITNINNNYAVNIPLYESYKAAGIELFEEGGEGYDATPYDPFKNIPEVFTEYQNLFRGA